MKKLTTIILLLVFAASTYAQNSASTFAKGGSVSGKVIDAKLNDPIPYVNIIIKNMSGETITGSITDDKGEFQIKDLPNGKMEIQIQFIGYTTQTREINIADDNRTINLGTIALEEEATGLDEVTVVAEVSSIQQKLDRKVVTVGKDLTT